MHYFSSSDLRHGNIYRHVQSNCAGHLIKAKPTSSINLKNYQWSFCVKEGNWHICYQFLIQSPAFFCNVIYFSFIGAIFLFIFNRDNNLKKEDRSGSPLIAIPEFPDVKRIVFRPHWSVGWISRFMIYLLAFTLYHTACLLCVPV
jgi:hypothetical protein